MADTVQIDAALIRQFLGAEDSILFALAQRIDRLDRMRSEWTDDPPMLATIEENKRQAVAAAQAVAALSSAAGNP